VNVFVATRETQGMREDDFSWTVEGELVRFPGLTCDDSGCGCERSMAGLASSRATTTFRVDVRPGLNRSGYRAALHDALRREGWIEPGTADDAQWVDDWADEHLAAAALFPAGTVLELRDGRLVPRTSDWTSRLQ
jgi:hypothetical protein